MPLDTNLPFEEVAAPVSTLDHSKPFEDVHEGLTNALFDLDGAPDRVGPEGKAAFDVLAAETDNSKETKAQAVNRAYVKEKMGVSPDLLEHDWPSVRDAAAKSLGHTEGSISETKFYDLATKAEQKTLKQRWANGGVWDRLGLMFGSHGYGNTEVEGAVPMIGSEAAGTKGGLVTVPKMEGTNSIVGLINAANKLTAGLMTPENVGIAAVTGGAGVVAELGALTRAAIVARSTQAAALGTFTAIGAKDTVDAVTQAKIVMNDPKATNADKADAIATAVLSGAMTIAAAKGTYDFAGSAKAESGAMDANAARMEGVRHLREMAEKADKPTAETLNKVADEIEALAPVVETPKETKPGEVSVEDLDGGGFVVIDKDGNRLYAQEKAKAETIAKQLEEAPKAEATAPATSEPAKATETTEIQSEPAIAAKQAVVGIKNASVDEALAKMGLEPATHGEKLTFEEARTDAAAKMEKDPLAGQKLVVSLEAEPRPVTGKENALLLHELTRLTNERAAAENAVIEAQNMGDPIALQEAKVRVQQATSDYARAADVDTKVGTANAIGLGFRNMMLREDYSLAAMERRRSVAANEGKPLSEPQQAEVKELHEKIAATQKAFDDYVAQQNKVVPFPKGKVATALSERAAEARARISERVLQATGSSFVEGEKSGLLSKENLNDLATVGADYLAKGVKELAAWSEAMVKEFGESVRPHLGAIFEKAGELKSNEARLAAKKTRLETGTEKLKEKIASKDFSPKEKPAPLHLDEEANRLQAEHDISKLEYDRLLEKDRYENLSTLQKAGENALVGWDATRSILAGFEFSAVARQGAFRLFSHPVETIKTMGDAFRALVSNEEGAHAINLKTLNDPDAAAAKINKLALVDEKSKLSKQEEVYMGKLVGKIPGVKNFEQFAHVFLNKVRLDMWREMRNDFPDANPRLLADAVNSATGRGSLGELERISVSLNRVLFSPRFLASRVQMGSGYYVWKAALGGDKAAVKAVSRQYARSMIGYGVFLSSLYAGFKAYTDEDVSISLDPNSSDFMKLKVGKTRIDLGAGLQQPLVFLHRLATGEKTNSKGKSVPIRGDNIPFGGQDAYQEAGRFVRSKFNPSLSKVVDFGTGKNAVGEPATLTDLLYPATYKDIKDAFEAHDVPEATLISLLAMFGAGVNTYDLKKKPKPK